jgi:uncharacterized membrane protein YuzA (DUF378 family)
MDKSVEVYIHMVCVILLLIGGLNWGLVGSFNLNLVKLINEKTFNSPLFENSIYILVGLCALYLGSNRNFYLPFLGDTVLAPSTLLRSEGRSDADIEVDVDAKGADLVMYWAAEPTGEEQQDGTKFAYDAYDKFSNAGVVPVINDKAKLKVKCPQQYWVKKWGVKSTLSKHVHYRLIYPNGWASEVMTHQLNC